MADEDRTREIDQLTAEAWDIRLLDMAEARERADRAWHLATEVGHTPGKADSLSILAYCDIQRGEFPQALNQAMRALEIYRELDHDKGQAYTAHLIGQAYRQMNDLPRALEHALPALEVARRIDDPRYLMGLYMTLGGAYVDRGDYDAALRCAYEVLETADEQTTPGFYADALNSIAFTYYLMGEATAGLDYVDRAIDLYERLNNPKSSLYALHTAGVIRIEMDRLDEARAILERGLARAETEGVRTSMIEFRVELGRLAEQDGDLDTASAHLHEALRIAEGLESPLRQAEAHYRLAEFHKANGDFERALHHYETFHALDKRVFNEQSDQRMRALQVQHEVAQAHKEAEAYHSENVALQEEMKRRQQTEQELRHLAAQDPLTGVYNRQHVERRAEGILDEAAQTGESVGIVLVDMDDFKGLNDTHGHLTGDTVLRELTRRILSLIREGDILGRYGGDEFIFLLRDATLEDCQEVAERIRRSIDEQTLAPRPDVPTTVSIGAVHRPAGDETDLLTLLERADEALYQAKNAGKNGVRLWANSSHQPA